jgi:peptide-methionine (S)-S-oxide reductase
VIRTRVGYTGGTERNPTYTNLGDHSEAIRIDYDPARITYEKLLEIFWESHNPISRSWSQQYRAALFYHDEEQKRLALETKDLLEGKLNQTIWTEILPASEFYAAEDYHQKYRLRNHRALMAALKSLFPDGEAFAASPAAARLNGYLGGHGTLSSLRAELTSLGLSPAALEKLMAIVSEKHR